MTQASTTTNRRRFIAGATLIAAAVSSGALWFSWGPEHRQTWVEEVLRKNLPGIQLDPDSLGKFVRSFAAGHEFDDKRMNVAVWMDQALPSVARRISKAERRLARLERLVVSDYLLGSNFFRVEDPRKEIIIYGGRIAVCGNPFAVFRDQ
jgi:predicted phosphoadenosine phosphosulfate sulfurtransferase